MSDSYDHSAKWIPYVVDGQTHPGVLIEAAGMSKHDGQSFLALVEPAGHTNPHVHSGDEILEIKEGIAELTLNGSMTVLYSGAIVRIVSGTVHSIRNSTAQVLIVRATFDPPFRQQITTLV